tara:strand:- start:56 stop:343 length:288 start_codon:yes stop_codon:yes gene_type:complete
MADFKNKPKDPNWMCTFSLKRNPDKKPGDNKPDLVLVDSEKINQKSGKPYRKNFTINGTWCEAACYIQENKDLKITIKKTGGDKPASNDGFDDQF